MGEPARPISSGRRRPAWGRGLEPAPAEPGAGIAGRATRHRH